MTPGFSHVIDLLKNLPDASLRIKNLRMATCQASLEHSKSQSNKNSLPSCSKETLLSVTSENNYFPGTFPVVSHQSTNNMNSPNECAVSALFSSTDTKAALDAFCRKRMQGHQPSEDTGSLRKYSGLSSSGFQKSCSNLTESFESNAQNKDSNNKYSERSYSTLPRPVLVPSDLKPETPHCPHDYYSQHQSSGVHSTRAIEPPVQFAGSCSNRINSQSQLAPKPNINTISKNVLESSSVFLHDSSTVVHSNPLHGNEQKCRKKFNNYFESNDDMVTDLIPRSLPAGNHDTKVIQDNPISQAALNMNQRSRGGDNKKINSLYPTGKREGKPASPNHELTTFC